MSRSADATAESAKKVTDRAADPARDDRPRRRKLLRTPRVLKRLAPAG